MFRFGIIGTSHFAASRMIPAIQAGRDTTVVAIASRDAGRASDMARALSIQRAYDSYEALLADPDVDAVYNPLPNHLHVPWSERAAAPRKPAGCSPLPRRTTCSSARLRWCACSRAGWPCAS